MSENNSSKSLFDWLGGIAAFLTVAVYAILVINANWSFIPESVLNVLAVIKTWAPLVVVAITGFEFTRGKGLITKILFYALMAVVILSMFFPGTWDEFVGIIDSKIK